VKELEDWADALESKPLTKEIIDAYEPIYAISKEALKNSIAARKALGKLVKPPSLPKKWNSRDFICDMAKYLATEEGRAGLAWLVNAAGEIKTLLHIPTMEFSKEEWNQFYRHIAFGRMRLGYPKMAENLDGLRSTLQVLLSDNLSREILEEVLAAEGKYHVNGLGTNLVTKVLCTSNRHRWPVFNRRVMQAFRRYDLEVKWGLTNTGNLQRNCVAPCPKYRFQTFGPLICIASTYRASWIASGCSRNRALEDRNIAEYALRTRRSGMVDLRLNDEQYPKLKVSLQGRG
jgi:hypothetical protein